MSNHIMFDEPAPQDMRNCMGMGHSGAVEVYGLCTGTEVSDFNHAGALLKRGRVAPQATGGPLLGLSDLLPGTRALRAAPRVELR